MSTWRQIRAPRGLREVLPLALTDQGSRPGPLVKGQVPCGVEGQRPSSISRRDAVLLTGAALAAMSLPATADLGDFNKIFAETTRGATPKLARVKLTMPELAENGNSVSTVIEVQSPMTEKDHVKTISLLAEKNPQTLMFRVHLGPRAGRARIATNVRLADTQRIVAVAEMSDGTMWMGEARVLVTLAACIDGG